jgi:hypothetical protein
MVCALRILPLFVFVVAGLISAPAHASNIKSRAAAFAIHRKEVGMSESRNINPTTLLMPAWIQAVNLHIPAHHEHPFRTNVNTYSGST